MRPRARHPPLRLGQRSRCRLSAHRCRDLRCCCLDSHLKTFRLFSYSQSNSRWVISPVLRKRRTVALSACSSPLMTRKGGKWMKSTNCVSCLCCLLRLPPPGRSAVPVQPADGTCTRFCWLVCSVSGGEGNLTPENGARALLEMATTMSTGGGSSAGGPQVSLSYATRARAIGAVFKLLPAATVDQIFG